MELKKDNGNAVAIDMMLIVHSEKRRAAQGTHSDPQAEPDGRLQRRGGNTRPARSPGPGAPRPPFPRARPPGGAPCAPIEVGDPSPLPHRCLCLRARGNSVSRQRVDPIVPG